MAEQNLDVKVTESGTAVVSSELSKLAGQLDKVTAAQEKETAAATRAAAASEKTAAGVTAFLAAQESKFAVVDRVAGLLGKFNLALELANKAYNVGKTFVDEYVRKVKDLAPALEAVNKQLAIQAKEVERIAGTRRGLIGAGGTLDEASQASKLEAQLIEAEARMLELDAEGQRTRAMAGKATQYKDAEGALPLPQIIEATARAGVRPLEVINRELELVQERAFGAQLKLDKLRADVDARNKGGGGDGGRGGGRGGGAPKEEDILASLPDLQSEWVKRLGIKSEGDPLAGDGAGPFDVVARGVNAATEAMRAGLDVVGEYATEVARVQAAYDAAASQAGAFAEATGKAALASAAAALVAGDSIAAALQVALESKGIEAGVEALWTLGKAFYYSVVAPPLAGPLFASAGYFAATAAAAGVGSALAGAAAGGGGGGGARGGAPTERDIGPRRQTGADAGGPTTINVQIDGLSLSTAGQVGEAFLGAMERLRNTPGQRSRLERVMTGGNR